VVIWRVFGCGNDEGVGHVGPKVEHRVSASDAGEQTGVQQHPQVIAGSAEGCVSEATELGCGGWGGEQGEQSSAGRAQEL